MKTNPLLLTLILLFSLSACGGSGQYYVLSLSSYPAQAYVSHDLTIGVEKVSVPAYLYKREIAVATSSSQINLLSGAKWGEDLDTGLTNRLVAFLQKKFHQPNVYEYPWGVENQPSIVVSVHITRFIAQGDKVYLDATWRIKNLKTKKYYAKLFSTTVATSSDAKSIVSSMDKALSELEERLASSING